MVYAAPSGKYTLDAGVNNGWDDVQFLGAGATAEFSALVNISPVLSLQAVTYNGKDFTLAPGSTAVTTVGPPNPIVRGNRMLYDFIGTFKVLPPLTLVAVYDNATQLETAYGVAPDGAPNAHWNSIAGYAEYTISSIFGLNLRGNVR